MSTMVERVAARFKAAQGLSKGDTLEVVMKRGNWWPEMRKGVKLVVKDVQGDKLTVNERGWAQGDFTMMLPPGQNLSDKFNLQGNLGRTLVVRRST